MHANLGDTVTNDYHLEQHQEPICFSAIIDEIVIDMPNVFGIPGDILAVGHEHDGRNHDKRVQKVLKMQRSQPKTK